MIEMQLGTLFAAHNPGTVRSQSFVSFVGIGGIVYGYVCQLVITNGEGLARKRIQLFAERTLANFQETGLAEYSVYENWPIHRDVPILAYDPNLVAAGVRRIKNGSTSIIELCHQPLHQG